MENATQVRSTHTDQTLIEALSNGEVGRFQELYQKYRDRVFGFAMRRSGNRADAEDITQETFLQVHRSISTYKGRASLSTWIFGIAHHTTCRHFRRQSKNTYSIENEGRIPGDFEENYEERRVDALRALEHCTSALARSRQPEHLEIFRLFYAENRPVRAIADLTGKPVDSIKDSLRRSRNLLIRDLPDLKLILNTAHSA
ncbi:MAG: sigma-70 family RNA polymerase sigma factor [Myxococcota bacterium]|nr:sigma-70 family RNA polymerase sigma factor [Myxococcota bacterium]